VLGRDGPLLVDRRRRPHLPTDAVDLHGLDDRIGHRLPTGTARHQCRELPLERHGLLDQHLPVPAAGLGENRPRRRGVVHRPNASAVVAATHRLDHDRPAGGLRELDHVRLGGHRSPARYGDADPAQPEAHRRLVLGVDQRGGAGGDGDAGALECRYGCRRHVLVVEGHDIAATGEVPERLGVAVVADHDVRQHLGGALVRGGGQDPQPHAETDRGLGRHPGQLTRPHHAHHRERHGGEA
jgi:hypothetical protein